MTTNINPKPDELLAASTRRVTIKRATLTTDDAILIQQDADTVLLRQPVELRDLARALNSVADRVEREREHEHRYVPPHDVQPGDTVYLAHPDPDGCPAGVLAGPGQPGRVTEVWTVHNHGGERVRVAGINVTGGVFHHDDRFDLCEFADRPNYAGHFVWRSSAGRLGLTIVVKRDD